MAALGVAGLVIIASRWGKGRDAGSREAVRAVIDERLASVDRWEDRLGRLEEEIRSLRKELELSLIHI